MNPPVKDLSPWWGLFAIFSIGFPLFFLFKPPPLEDYGALPSFSLLDQNQREITQEDFQGSVSISNFIFTRCKDVCPALSTRMAHVQESIPSAKLFSITVDPEYDTPTILKEYANRFNADHESWRFLTGSKEQQHTVTRGFQQAYERQNTDEKNPVILHSQKFILVDKNGHIRGFYPDNAQGTKDLISDYHSLKWFF
ncbi:MAG: SCO family protein [Myxococcota bacterium]|nr:SCO family protein [Myxococcota bacterium]